MNFTFKTIIIWDREKTTEECATRDAKLADMAQRGLTDGVNTLGRRYWTTEEAANEWIAFTNTFSPPPTSANAYPQP